MALLLQDVVEAAAFRLGNRTGLDSVIQAEAIRLQSRFERGIALSPPYTGNFLPWFLLSENKFNNTVAGESRVRVPTDFIAEYEEGCLWVFDENDERIPLDKEDQDVLAVKYAGLSQLPQEYALTNQYFRLYPIPDAVYKLEILVYRSQPTFAPNTENKWFDEAFDFVVAETALSVARAQNDVKRVATLTILRAEEAKNLYDLHGRRVTTNRDYQKED